MSTYDPHADVLRAALKMANPLSTLFLFYNFVFGIVFFCNAGSGLLLFYASMAAADGEWPLLLGMSLAFGALALLTGHRTVVRMRMRRAAWEVRSARDREREEGGEGEEEERMELLRK